MFLLIMGIYVAFVLLVVLPVLFFWNDYWKVVSGIFRTVGRLVASNERFRHAIMIFLAIIVIVSTVVVTAKTACDKSSSSGVDIDPTKMKDIFEQRR